jgi:hypothetical protein
LVIRVSTPTAPYNHRPHKKSTILPYDRMVLAQHFNEEMLISALPAPLALRVALDRASIAQVEAQPHQS